MEVSFNSWKDIYSNYILKLVLYLAYKNQTHACTYSKGQ